MTRFLARLICLLFLCLSIAAQTKPPGPSKTKIRCITAFVRLDRSRYQLQIADAVKFLKIAQTTFESRDFTVQTLRIATQPFPEYTQGLSHDEAQQWFKDLDGLAQMQNVVISIGPAYLSGDDGEAQADLLADILENSKYLYGSVNVTTNAGVNWPAIRAAARVMKKLSDSTLHGDGTFHFAALASVPQATPFFPAANPPVSDTSLPSAWKSANEVAAAVRDTPDAPTANRRLIDLFFQLASNVENVALRIDSERGWTYLGLDLSPATSEDASIVTAIENISHGASGLKRHTLRCRRDHLGHKGNRSAQDRLLRRDVAGPRIPWSAQRWSAGLVSLDSLLSYSSVCGTGLDTVPLPGTVTEEQLTRIIGDVATLSVKWNKPLTARLLPVPGKAAGQQSDFSDPHLLKATIQPISGPEPH